MDVPALYRRSHSHLRVKNSRIFFNTGSSPPCRADEIPDVRRGSLLDASRAQRCVRLDRAPAAMDGHPSPSSTTSRSPGNTQTPNSGVGGYFFVAVDFDAVVFAGAFYAAAFFGALAVRLSATSCLMPLWMSSS